MNQRLLPMLAVPSAPFDSSEYLLTRWIIRAVHGL
jgi:hypothetical protein